jgi:hypothetical protein
MRISFDIDDTLICRDNGVPTERGLLPSFIHARVSEPLRQGTRSLFAELRRQGYNIWIYTTSVRTSFQIRLWLVLHGLRVDGIVNDARHRNELAGHNFSRIPSKYPPAFGIDLHVDDRPDNERWAQQVLDAAELVATGTANGSAKACPPPGKRA